LFKDRSFSKEWFKSYLLIIQGALIAAAGYNFFLIPHKIIPGGVFGIGTILFHTFSLPAGVVAIVLNIPLLLIGIKILGPRFGAKTVVGMVLVSLFNDGMNYLWPDVKLSGDMLVSCIIGGFLVGTGVAMIFKAKATTGGTDIIGQIAHKKWKMPAGQVMLSINGFIVLGGALAIVFTNPGTDFFKILIYAVVANFVSSKTIDVTLDGTSFYKGLFIISDRYEEIKEKLIKDVRRGGTLIPAKGMFQDKDKKIIFTAVSRRETAYMKEYIKKIDPQAFFIIFQTNEVYGTGFFPVEDID
jgi:uncharacterized membrane-anchored protein YitT (DUF2179 family)